MSLFLSLNIQNVPPLSLSGSESLYRLWLRDHPPPPGPACPLPALAGGQARLSAEMHGSVYLFNPLDLFIRFKSPLFDKSPESGGGSGSLDTEVGPRLVHTCFLLTPLPGSLSRARPLGRGSRTARPWKPSTGAPGFRRPAWPGEAPQWGLDASCSLRGCCGLTHVFMARAADAGPDNTGHSETPLLQLMSGILAWCSSLSRSTTFQKLCLPPTLPLQAPGVKPPEQLPSLPQAHCATGKLWGPSQSP